MLDCQRGGERGLLSVRMESRDMLQRGVVSTVV